MYQQAGLVEGTRTEMAAKVCEIPHRLLICEIPMVYPRGSGKGEDPNDLIQVALSAGAVLGAAVLGITVYPAEWKGQLPKDIHHKRVRAHVSFSSLAEYDVERVAPNLQHNVLDAIGIGIWANGDGEGLVRRWVER